MDAFVIVFVVAGIIPMVLAVLLLAWRDKVTYRNKDTPRPPISKHNRDSLCWGIPGFLLLHGGSFIISDCVGGSTELRHLTFLCGLFAGWLFLFLGLRYYAKAKGRNPAWAWLALLGAFGVIALGLMRDCSGRSKTYSLSSNVIIARKRISGSESTKNNKDDSDND